MKRLKKVLMWIGISFIAFCALCIIVATLFPTTSETPSELKKVIRVEKSKPKAPAPAPAPKPKPKVQKPARPEYTAQQVYDFVCRYEVRSGQTVANIVDLAVITLRSSGHSAEVVEGQAQEYGIKGLWVVSCVVVVDSFERTQIRFEADMRNKTVRPLNKVARDLWGLN